MTLSHEIWAPDSETPKSDRYNGKILFLERPEPTAEIFPVKLSIFTEPQRRPHVKISSQQKVIRSVMFLYGACLVCLGAAFRVHTAPAACTPGHCTPDSANSSHCTPLRSGRGWLSAPRRLLPAGHEASDTAGRSRPQLPDCPFLLCSAPVGLPGVASRAVRIGREFPERVVVDGGVPKPDGSAAPS